MLLRICLSLLTFLSVQAQDKVAALGAAMSRDLSAKTTTLHSEAIARYLETLGRRLGGNFTFTVISDPAGGPIHEPIAFPGGYIFIPANLILNAQSEAELVGMLAHASAHLDLQHGRRMAARWPLARSGGVPLLFVGTQGEGTLPVALASAQREFEREADAQAVQVVWVAGYDPDALAQYIARSFHDEGRLGAMQKAIAQLPYKAYRSASEFPVMQEEVRRLSGN